MGAGDNTYDPAEIEYNVYTVMCITNTGHVHDRHPAQVVYVGSNKLIWSLPVKDWPGNLVEEKVDTKESQSFWMRLNLKLRKLLHGGE